MWYLLREVVFLYFSGNNALWVYLDFLKDSDAGLMTQPIGRKKNLVCVDVLGPSPFGCGEDDDEGRYPTIVYACDVVGVYMGISKVLYMVFTNELDGLTAFQSLELNKSIFEGSDALSSARETREKFHQQMLQAGGLLGCTTSTDAYFPATPMHLASSSYAASSSRVVGEDKECEEEDVEEKGGDEEGEYEEDDEERE
ncbi:hypothetical protein D1007_13311 [Hordeum vulgare]|nr:hypothetical protein D1007_13311 [Hordeum vulgare]